MVKRFPLGMSRVELTLSTPFHPKEISFENVAYLEFSIENVAKSQLKNFGPPGSRPNDVTHHLLDFLAGQFHLTPFWFPGGEVPDILRRETVSLLATGRSPLASGIDGKPDIDQISIIDYSKSRYAQDMYVKCFDEPIALTIIVLNQPRKATRGRVRIA